MAIKQENNGKSWLGIWKIRKQPVALANAERCCIIKLVLGILPIYVFKQWENLKHMRIREIQLIGDIPFFVGLDSVMFG